MTHRALVRIKLGDSLALRRAARFAAGTIGAISLILTLAAAAAAQQSSLHEAFERIDNGTSRRTRLTQLQQPFDEQSDSSELAEEQQSTIAVGESEKDAGNPVPDGESLPAPSFEGRVPLAGSLPSDEIQLSQNADGLITLIVRDASLSRVLALLAQTQGLNLVASNDLDTALISITLRDVPLEEALTAILSVANYTWVERNNIILITSLADSANLPPDVQGRQIQVFELDFASAQTVAEAITGFLSPVGKVSVSETDPADNRMTRELVVVEDMPDPLARISAYICQVDRPPRQVLIEAHILQVTLDDTNRQGVNLDQFARLANADLTIKTTGFANSAAPQAFMATLEGGDLGGIIELVQTMTDAKSLGSPKLLVLNEQEARLQVGDQLGFKVTTTTETSTLESVQFLDVGVVLSIIPRITRDGHVLLHVKPEVSTGEVNPDTGLPEESTTELETDVMLRDGQGMVIGGLIKESDSVTQSKIPWIGDVKGLGWFFRRTEVTKERVEIIVALVPRVQPYDLPYQEFEQGELVRAGVPLLEGPLCRTHRPWEPVLPDGDRVSKPLFHGLKHQLRRRGAEFSHYHGKNSHYVVPRHPLPQQRFYGDYYEPGLQQPGSTDCPQPLSPETPLDLRPGGEVWHAPEIISDQP